ncbi:MAG: Uma2 family endonuclease [Candidatus Thiothrix moscowensis]|nr:Uma2 family endonuclease [Candidatus Thiothrix moscowensis]
MQFHISQITFPPDAEVIIRDVPWGEFERFMEELGERSSLRIHYSNKRIHLMAPSAGHEVPKVVIGDFIKYMLEHYHRDFQGFGSVTLRNPSVEKAVEADECFYIEHEAAVRGKDKISLDIDPPPDLAVEIDIYSATDRGLYAALGVPELWIYDGKRLEMLLLRDGDYVAVDCSPHFPGLRLRDKVPALIALGKQDGRNAAMKTFRAWVQEQAAGVGSRG